MIAVWCLGTSKKQGAGRTAAAQLREQAATKAGGEG